MESQSGTEITNIQDIEAQFFAWEKTSRETIDFKKVYVDIAGDLVAGLVLSQIIYWHLPDRNGVTKLRVSHDNHLWIAKKRDEWWDEIRITPRQLDRALAILEGKHPAYPRPTPLIFTALFQFAGAPTKHIRINWEGFGPAVQSQIFTKGENRPILPKGQKPGFSPKVKIDLHQRSKSYTEITAETTTETTISAHGANAPSQGCDPELATPSKPSSDSEQIDLP